MAAKRRPVITGIGAVTPLAPSLDETIARLREGKSARAIEMSALDARSFFTTPKSIKLTDNRTRFVVAAAAMALREAGLTTFDADRAGVVIGSSGSDLQAEDLGRALGGADAQDIARFGEQILSGLNPLWLLVNLPNMVSAHVSIQFDLRGPNSTVMTDWIAGLQAIGEAASWIESGEADVVVAGGAESGVLPFVLSNYEGFFRRDVFGDGAAVFVLEEREHALRRGARIQGEIVAAAVSDDLATSMEDALARAGWRTSDVAGISPAWIPHHDYRAFEDAAIAALFGDERPRVAPSHREALGFALAAASTIDLAIHLRSMTDAPKLVANSLGFLRQAASLCIAMETAA